MKQLHIVVLLCLLIFMLCACSETHCVDGIENFQVDHSNYELNVYLLPSDDFVDRFAHINIDYHYRAEYETYLSIAGTEKTFLVTEYEQEIYEQAKTFCLQNLQLSDVSTMEYNGYIFVENTKLAVQQNRFGKANAFPKWFNIFAYNDSLRQLVFIGFYSPDYSSEDAQNVCDNWGEFIEKHFSDIYDWGQGDSRTIPSS